MKKYIAIIGPTASGKTSLSIELARVLNAEIVSADSRQIYKNIPIATATPTFKEKKRIPHYFIEEIELNKEFNAGDFGRLGRKKLKEIFEKGKLPIVVGGSGLYLQSLIDGLFDEEIESKELRKELNDELKIFGKEHMYNKLVQVDPESASRMTPDFYRRVIRALEVFYASGKKISDLYKKNVKPDFEAVQFGIMLDRKNLYERINLRVDKMLEDGLIDEVLYLKEKGIDYKSNNSLNTVGIKEVFKYFEKEYSYDEMVSYIKQNSRRYAKRQISWFNRDKRIIWINGEKDKKAMIDEIIENFKLKGGIV